MNVWSCSKFARWLTELAGVKTFFVGTAEEWDAHKIEFAAKAPVTFWFVHSILDNVQAIVMYPFTMFETAGHVVRNSFTHPSWYMDTNLSKTEYHEIDTRFLHGAMTVLQDYVEVELAAQQGATHRSPSVGVKALRDTSNIVYDDSWGYSPEEEKYGEKPQAALDALEILKIYTWWTVVRPFRKDAWAEYISTPNSVLAGKVATDEEEEIVENAMRIDAEYYQQDTDMLVRLMKIRASLYT